MALRDNVRKFNALVTTLDRRCLKDVIEVSGLALEAIGSERQLMKNKRGRKYQLRRKAIGEQENMQKINKIIRSNQGCATAIVQGANFLLKASQSSKRIVQIGEDFILQDMEDSSEGQGEGEDSSEGEDDGNQAEAPGIGEDFSEGEDDGNQAEAPGIGDDQHEQDQNDNIPLPNEEGVGAQEQNDSILYQEAQGEHEAEGQHPQAQGVVHAGVRQERRQQQRETGRREVARTKRELKTAIKNQLKEFEKMIDFFVDREAVRCGNSRIRALEDAEMEGMVDFFNRVADLPMKLVRDDDQERFCLQLADAGPLVEKFSEFFDAVRERDGASTLH